MMSKIIIDDFTTTWGNKLYMKVILIHQWVSVLIFLCIAIVFSNILTNSLIASYNNSLSGFVKLVGSRIQTDKNLSFSDRRDIPANITGLYIKDNTDKKIFDSNSLDSIPHIYKLKVQDKGYTVTVFATNLIDQIRFIRCNIMLVTVLIILLFSNLIKRTTDAILTKPLNSFMDFIRVLQSGNINIRLHPIRNDELGELGKCLDDLLDENSSLLEKQVLTEKLKAANTELQHNIDILRKTQDKIVQVEKLSSLAELVAGIAHEMNTPVGNSLVSTSLALRSCKDFIQNVVNVKNSSKTLSCDVIISNFNDIVSVLNILMENLNKTTFLVKSFQQVYVDSNKETKTKIDILEYTNQIVRMNIDKYPDAKHTINVTCENNLNIPLYLNSYMTLISNLIENSFVHAFENKEHGEININIIDKGKSIIIKFSDNGIGMNEDTISKLYNPFFTTKRGEHGGLGLGAHIVYNIVVQKFQGDISVKSTENQGTTFTITIPK